MYKCRAFNNVTLLTHFVCSLPDQLAGIVPQRDRYEPDLTADAGTVGAF